MTIAAHNLSQRFPQRRAFITGAASGLGLACAEILAREGWQLVLADVDAPRLDLVAQSLARDGAPSVAIACDVRDEAAVRALVDQAAAAFGGLDVAIHSAGVATAGAFHTSTAEDWRWMFDIHLLGESSHTEGEHLDEAQLAFARDRRQRSVQTVRALRVLEM